MKAKKLVLVALAVFAAALLIGTVSAEEHKIGHLSRSNVICRKLDKQLEN